MLLSQLFGGMGDIKLEEIRCILRRIDKELTINYTDLKWCVVWMCFGNWL